MVIFADEKRVRELEPNFWVVLGYFWSKKIYSFFTLDAGINKVQRADWSTKSNQPALGVGVFGSKTTILILKKKSIWFFLYYFYFAKNKFLSGVMK